VALVEDSRGAEILPKLIRGLDDLVCEGETIRAGTFAPMHRNQLD